MGVNYGQRRQRSSDLVNPTDIVMASRGADEFKKNHYDEQQIYDVINAKLDIQEAKLKEKTQFFVR